MHQLLAQPLWAGRQERPLLAQPRPECTGSVLYTPMGEANGATMENLLHANVSMGKANGATMENLLHANVSMGDANGATMENLLHANVSMGKANGATMENLLHANVSRRSIHAGEPSPCKYSDRERKIGATQTRRFSMEPFPAKEGSAMESLSIQNALHG